MYFALSVAVIVLCMIFAWDISSYWNPVHYALDVWITLLYI